MGKFTVVVATQISDHLSAMDREYNEYLQEMNREVLSKYNLLTVGETAGVTIEEAKKYANLDGTELEWYFSLNM